MRLHPGQVTAIGVLPDPGVTVGTLAERLSRALSGTPAQIYTGDARGPLEFPDAANARVLLISLSGVLGGTALLVAVLVVTSVEAVGAAALRKLPCSARWPPLPGRSAR